MEKMSSTPTIQYEDTNYWIYVSNESMKCFVCNTMGHLAKNCPQGNHILSTPKNTSDVTLGPTENPNYILEESSNSKVLSQADNTNLPSKDFETSKGIKRIRSSTTSEPSHSDLNQTTDLVMEEIVPSSDYTNDTDSNFSLEEEIPSKKNLKKKKKTLDNRSEEQVWTDIKIEIKELENEDALPHFPLTLDRFRKLLDETRNKQNIQEILQDYTENTAELVTMCLFIHPKLSRNLKNRCSRLTRKLQELSLMKDK
ncbi:uncharacterized protein LOC121740573 [Aricia agestis]|uniref:uncharacterized protein LOC121725474 n=1 Tax=Aricia agestis TaxID=91739 RepID=UPI001C202741|nr:uncharacterized protein LOC121725474 [Aricia agestis]XP_041989237.1 uncharacterized protein LOC121740568 [Aricia agestis]XP_041989243.1 uncharacterized protein LOC121740573 [Aricia agestis]